MKTLKESILAGVEDTLSVDNAYTKVYNAPKIHDFKRVVNSGLVFEWIEWICPGLIQEYIDVLDATVISPILKSDIIGFRVDLHDIYIMDVYLISNVNDYKGSVALEGFGSSDGLSIYNQKKQLIEFFKQIQNNPSKLKRVFEYVNKCQNELITKGECECSTFKQILKY